MAQTKIYVAGHRGMVGSAIVRALQAEGHKNIVTCSRSDLDLCNQTEVKAFFENQKPNQVYLAAAKVGGIHANSTYPADFIYQNIMIQANIIDAAFRNGVKKLLFLGSSCIYPKFATQPMGEHALLSGPLEPTNEPYALAKIAGIKLCESYNRQHGKRHQIEYRSIMPTNLYGPGDNYHPENSHVIPALIRRFHEAKINRKDSVSVWGSGSPMREFLFVDDLATACLHVMQLEKTVYEKFTSEMQSHINVGTGEEISILALAKAVKEIVGYQGDITFDRTKPDGSPRKLLDSSRLKMSGWEAKVTLKEGLQLAYDDFLKTNSLKN